jgi:hypothetical protein
LPTGIPSYDTLGRVFAMLDPAQFDACFLAWVRHISELLPGQVVPIGGETLRRSLGQRSGKGAIHVVSAGA